MPQLHFFYFEIGPCLAYLQELMVNIEEYSTCFRNQIAESGDVTIDMSCEESIVNSNDTSRVLENVTMTNTSIQVSQMLNKPLSQTPLTSSAIVHMWCTGPLITGSLVRTHSWACFIIHFTSLSPTFAWPSLLPTPSLIPSLSPSLAISLPSLPLPITSLSPSPLSF